MRPPLRGGFPKEKGGALCARSLLLAAGRILLYPHHDCLYGVCLMVKSGLRGSAHRGMASDLRALEKGLLEISRP